MTAIGYVRRSKESGERTVSLTVQEQRVREYAGRLGADVARIVTHDGVSGGDAQRYAALDQAIRAHHATLVVAYHLDRYSRDTAEGLAWLRRWARRGVTVHVVGRGAVDVLTAAGELVTTVELAAATHYRRLVGEKTKDALAQLRADGRRYSRHIPYGLTLNDDGRLVADPAEQAVLARVRALAGHSMREIARTLAAAGVFNRAGRPFGPSTIHRILRDAQGAPFVAARGR